MGPDNILASIRRWYISSLRGVDSKRAWRGYNSENPLSMKSSRDPNDCLASGRRGSNERIFSGRERVLAEFAFGDPHGPRIRLVVAFGIGDQERQVGQVIEAAGQAVGRG